MTKLRTGRIIVSPASGARYRIASTLGEGGFGTAYLAEEVDDEDEPLREVCFKMTPDQTSWHRESYFGELMTGNRRVIQMLDTFPLLRASGMEFCLVLELADHGTIADYLEKTDKPWTPSRAVREIKALLKMLDQLHGANATHRDITPMNIFVCRGGTLKLGDFGIARHELSGSPKGIEAFNPEFVTRGFLESRHRYWLAVDDVFQMGQLLGVLLSGELETAITAAMVNRLDLDDDLKAIIKRAIGPRAKRYADAYEMLQALEGDHACPVSKINSLDGKSVVFTGPMSMKRFDAEVLVLQAGGRVARRVTRGVDILVQGGRSTHYKDGHKGSKLQEAQNLLKQGHDIAIIGETEFRSLVQSRSS